MTQPPLDRDYYQPQGLSVRFYDALTSIDPSVRGDIEFYAGQLRAPGERVLELGCGTGRVALALAARGFQVFGVDSSSAMLEIAERKRRDSGTVNAKRVMFLASDLLNLQLPIQFHTVIVPFYTFNHLRDRRQRAKALAVMARHLIPGRSLVIHAISPEMLKLPPSQGPAVVLNFDDPPSRLEVSRGKRVDDPDGSRSTYPMHYRYLSRDGEQLEEALERLTYSGFAAGELERLADKAGLRLVQTLDSFEASRSGKERIYLLEKPC
jgi:ubiquinone/menaquinone biosynthesis C-methylase UbiE